MRNITFSGLRSGCWIVAVLVVLGSSAESATLRWRFQKGETLRWVQESKFVNHIKQNGQDGKTTMAKTVEMHWTVKSVDPDGSAEVTQTIDRMRMKLESSKGNLEYDSKARKEPDDAIGKLYKAMAGAESSFTISPSGELSNVTLPAPLRDILKGAGTAMGKDVNKLLSEPALGQPLPQKTVSKGETWSNTVELQLPFGKTTIEKTYRFIGPDPKADGLDVIDLTTERKTKPGAAAPVTVKSQSHEGKGTFHFDEKAGRIVRSRVTETTETVINENFTMKTETTDVMRLVDPAKD